MTISRSKMMHLYLLIIVWTSTYQKTVCYEEDTFDVPTISLESLHLTLSSKLLLDINAPGAASLKGYLGWVPNRNRLKYTSCSDEKENTICIMYGSGMKLLVTSENIGFCEKETVSCSSVTCHQIKWLNHIGGTMDCFLLEHHNWYGGGLSLDQKWPMQSNSKSWYATVTGDPIHHSVGSIFENTWYSSNGFLVHVEDHVPLFVNFNESGSGKLCLTSSTKKHPYNVNIPFTIELSYSVCSGMSLKEIFLHGIKKWHKKSKDIPEESVFQYPIWSTWAKFKSNINQNTTLQFGREIKSKDFPTSQLEIDDKWEECYGSLVFNGNKFPNPQKMIQELNKIGFVTTLWVHPFCNMDCGICMKKESKDFWVKDTSGEILEVRWWNGDHAAILDVTNKDAVQWMTNRLKALQEKYGIDSFKFDAGEVLWIGSNYILNDTFASSQPNLYSKAYAEMAENFGGRVEVRTGWRTQHLPIFVRMFDKFSRWDHNNGLRTLIPSALQLSLMGYYFILPDMIGGNSYNNLPDRELYLRWLEATVFLPVLQFSIPPWDYDEEVVKISRKMVDLHNRYSTTMLALARQAILTGEPIIRPLWWLSPDDKEAQRSDSQFLLGDNVLVAPVLKKGKNQRDIYLPDGKWADVQRGKMYEGAQWLYGYEAPLNFIPFFVRHS